MIERVLNKAIRTPWAITPNYLAIVQDVLISRARGIRLTEPEIQARIEAVTGQQMAATRPDVRTDGVVVVIPIHGVICNRSFEASSGSTSAEYVSAASRHADEDPMVKAVLYDFSTPGGVVDGVPELAKQMRGMTKPTVAFVNTLAASAGYWLAAQCDEIVIRESGSVGSIGVFTLSEDWSEYLAKEGIKVNAISAGEYKLEGAPWEPLSDEARAFIQGEVDACYAKFLAAVAAGRETSVVDVKKNYGKGRSLSAPQALAVGMVDKVGEIDVAIGRANALAKSSSKRVQSLFGGQRAEQVLPPERFMGDPQGQQTHDRSAGIQPHADGTCPSGYEKRDDGLCYLPPADDTTDDTAAQQVRAQQAQADRDRLAIAQA